MRILRRLHEEVGQGLIEVLGVLVLFGALVAVSAPAVLAYQDGKANREAKDRLLAAVPAAEIYRSRHGNSYAGLDSLDLIRIDPRVSGTLAVSTATRGRFCLTESVHGKTWSLAGPVGRKLRYFAQPSCRR